MKQTVYNKKLSSAQGFFAVLGLAAALIALNYLTIHVLAGLMGYTAASIVFWLVGAVIAIWVFQEFVNAYSYELGEDVLRLNHAYGKRDRIITDIYLSQLLFIGTPEEARAKYPQVKLLRAYPKRSKAKRTALVYDSAAGKCMALLQANDALVSALTAKIKGK